MKNHTVIPEPPSAAVFLQHSWTGAAQSALRNAPDFPPALFDVETIVPELDGPAILFGDPETYKTFIALHIAACMATGDPVFGRFPTRKRNTAIFVNFDSSMRGIIGRARGLGKDIDNLIIISPETFDWQSFEALLRANPGSFVVVDCHADTYFPEAGTDIAESMRRYCKRMHRLFEETNCNGFLIDHAKKPQATGAHPDRMYGSVQKRAATKTIIFVERVKNMTLEPSVHRVRIVCDKMSDEEHFAPFDVDVRFSEDEWSIHYAGAATPLPRKADPRALIESYLRTVADASREEIEGATHLSRHQVHEAIKGGWCETIGAGTKTRYRLAPCDEAEDDSTPEGDGNVAEAKERAAA